MNIEFKGIELAPAAYQVFGSGYYVIVNNRYSEVKYSDGGEYWMVLHAGSTIYIEVYGRLFIEDVVGVIVSRASHGVQRISQTERHIYQLIANPAAGSESAHHTLVRDAMLVSIHVKLVTDANVANRDVKIEYYNGTDELIVILGYAHITASNTMITNFCVGFGARSLGGTGMANIELPSVLLQEGWSFMVGVQGIQTGDQLSEIRCILKEG